MQARGHRGDLKTINWQTRLLEAEEANDIGSHQQHVTTFIGHDDAFSAPADKFHHSNVACGKSKSTLAEKAVEHGHHNRE